MRGVIPTSENIVVAIWRELAPAIEPGQARATGALGDARTTRSSTPASSSIRSADSAHRPSRRIRRRRCDRLARTRTPSWCGGSSRCSARTRSARGSSGRPSASRRRCASSPAATRMTVDDVVGERAVRGGAREHGDGARHRALLAVRAPHAAVLREGARRLHPERKDRRAVEAAAHRRDVRAAAPGAGAAHRADRQGDRGGARSRAASAW